VDVQQLSDLYEIQQLKARYFRFLDRRDWDEWRQLFTDDVEVQVADSPVPEFHAQSDGSKIVGADALVAYMSQFEPPRITVHQGHTPDITFVDDDHATGIWAMFNFVEDPGRRTAQHAYGYYHESYTRGGDGKWRIDSIRLERVRPNVPVAPTGNGA
jgi:ketosteroid isomerase-like protein